MKHILDNASSSEFEPWITLDNEGVHYMSLNKEISYDVRIKFAVSESGQVQLILDKAVCTDIIANGVSIYNNIDSDGYYSTTPNSDLDVYYTYINRDGKVPAGAWKIGETESSIILEDAYTLKEIQFNDTITNIGEFTIVGDNWAGTQGTISAPIIILPNTLQHYGDVYGAVVDYKFWKDNYVVIYNGISYHSNEDLENAFLANGVEP